MSYNQSIFLREPYMASVYVKLEKILKQSKQPLTCTDLYDKPEIRATVKDADEVSDRLGYMWRRKLLSRVPAPRTGVKSARYAYSWRTEADKPVPPITVDDLKSKKFGGLSVRRESDGTITLVSDKLEINVKRR